MLLHLSTNNRQVLAEKYEVSFFVYQQHVGFIFCRVVTVGNPNYRSSRDSFEPDSDVAVCGIAGSEEAQLKGSILGDQGAAIVKWLGMSNDINCMGNLRQEHG